MGLITGVIGVTMIVHSAKMIYYGYKTANSTKFVLGAFFIMAGIWIFAFGALFGSLLI